MSPDHVERERAPTTDLRVEAVEALTDGVAVVRSSDLGLVLTNRGWRRLFREEGTLTDVLDLMGDDLTTLLSDIRRALDQHGVWRRTVAMRDREGTVFDCRVSVSPSHHPDHRAVWVIGATDVTAEIDGRRRLQDELDVLQAELTELRVRTRARERFLSALAHELRSPIAAVSGQVELLLEGSSQRSADETHDQIAISLAELLSLADRMSGGVDGDEVTGRPPRRLVLVLEVDAALLRMRSLLRRRRVTVDVPGHLEISADDAALAEVLEHLVATAVKYTAAGSPLRVSAHGTAQGRVRLEVHDEGPGVASRRLALLFESEPGSTRNVLGNAGVGLAAVRRYVEEQGGAYGIDSADDEGSTFWVELPLSPGPGASADTPAGSSVQE